MVLCYFPGEEWILNIVVYIIRDPAKSQQDPEYELAPTFVEFVDYLLDTGHILFQAILNSK